MKYTQRKIKNNLFHVVAITMFVLFIATGCNRQETVEKTTEKTTEKSSTEIEVSDDIRWNPLHIQGYHYFEDGKNMNASGDVKLFASIDAEAKVGQEYLSSISMVFCDEESVVLDYMTSPASSISDSLNGEEMEFKQKLVAFSATDMKQLQEVELDYNSQIYNRLGTAISVTTFKEDTEYRILDSTLQEKYVLEEGSYESLQITSDGERAYYVKNKRIYRYQLNSDKHEEIYYDNTYYVEYINGILTNGEGVDYILFQGIAANYQKYEFVMRADTGEIICAYDKGYSFAEINQNVYVADIADENYQNRWIVHDAKNQAYDYQWNNNSIYMLTYVLQNHNILFASTEGDALYLGVYQSDSGEQIASTRIEISDIGGSVYLYQAPFCIDENTLLLQMLGENGARYYAKWEMSNQDIIFEDMVVTEHIMGSYDMVDLSACNNYMPSPGALSEELKPLKDKADVIEEEYEVDICIGEECTNVIGDYVILPLIDYDSVEMALDSLKAELAKYPKDFFHQLVRNGDECLRFYLAAELHGITEEGLEMAAGYQTYYENREVIVLDAQDSYSMKSSVHHEVCHVIQGKITEWVGGTSESVYNEAEWVSFNPETDMYQMSYGGEINEQYNEYSYMDLLYKGEDVSNACFVDYYGMTYPKEDMARIFEAVMSDSLFQVDFRETPVLREKLNLLCRYIRESFDTTQWSDIPWEEYMTE